MSKTVIGIVGILAVAALVPLGLIALSRSRPSPGRAIHPVLDMDKQPKFKSQRVNAMFADGRAMRPPVPGTIARDGLKVPGSAMIIEDPAAHDRILLGLEKKAEGKMDYVTQIPVPMDMELMRRGREWFDIYCSACHGLSGYGDGMVSRRAAEMQAAGSDSASRWVAPLNYHSEELRKRPVGSLYNTISNGIRNMPAHGSQITVHDRWAIVAYLKALQRSQNARPEEWAGVAVQGSEIDPGAAAKTQQEPPPSAAQKSEAPRPKSLTP